LIVIYEFYNILQYYQVLRFWS